MFKAVEFDEWARFEVTIGLAILGGIIGLLIGIKVYHNGDYEKAMEKIKQLEHDRLKRKVSLANIL